MKVTHGQKATVFVASNSAGGKEITATLAKSMGFQVFDAGGLKNARDLEPLAGLNIYLRYGAGLCTAIAPTWTSIAALAQTPAENSTTPPPQPERQAPKVERNLKKLDTLDFEVFSNQKWDRPHESHGKDIVVTWPDGHETRGIDKHIEDLKAMFVFAPDIAIKTHPIRLGSGTWTSVTGVMTGTFTTPMPLADGKSIPPTGKRFAISMATSGCSGTTRTS